MTTSGVIPWCVAAIVGLASPLAASPSPVHHVGSAALPGGVEGLRRALGDRLAMSPATVVAELTRRFYDGTDAAAERDPGFARFRAWLRAAGIRQDAGVPAPATMVPLPGPLDFWREIGLDAVEADDLIPAILRDRGAALLYTALMSMDPATRSWFIANPDVVRALPDLDRGALLVAAPYLRLGANRWELPGGAEADAIWTNYVGVPPDAPAEFLRALVRSHSGQLTFLLEVLATLSAEQQRTALGLVRLKPDVSAAAAFGSAVRALVGSWRPGERPFWRPSPDPSLLLVQISVDARGRLALPGGRRFWDLVLEDDTPTLSDAAAQAAWRDGEPLSPAWLVARLARAPAEQQSTIYQQALFAARLLADAPASEAAAVAAAIRARSRFPPLMRVLERIGIADAPRLARMAQQADVLTRGARDWRTHARLVQWQATLALLDRTAYQGTSSARAREAAIDSLARPLSSLSDWPCRDWLTAVVPGIAGGIRAPAVEVTRAGRVTARPMERALLAHLATSSIPPRQVAWEGTIYNVDLSAAEHERLERVRGRDSRPLLDAALALDGWLAHAGSQSAEATLGDLTALSAATAIDRRVEPDDEYGRRAQESALRARQLLAAVGGAVPSAVPARIADVREALATLALVELAYAVNMGWAEDLPLTAAAASRRHVFVRPYGPARRRFWIAPAINGERQLPWHVSGSLLELDVALAPVAMRRLSLRPLPDVPLLNTGDRTILVATAAALNPRHFGDEAQQAAVELVRGARRRIENVEGPADVRRLAADARLSGLRATAAEWLAGNDREALGRFFTMTEMLRIGVEGRPTPGLFDRWGNFESALTGGSDAGRLPALPVERYAGTTRRLLAVALPDLQVALAVRLAELGLPAALVPAVAASATLDLVNTAPSRFADDWQAVVDRVRSIDAGAVERYLGLLTTRGPLRLVPAVRR